MTLEKAIQTFLKKMEIKINEKELFFLYNGRKLDIYSNQTLKEYFMGNMDPIIIVHEVIGLIGA